MSYLNPRSGLGVDVDLGEDDPWAKGGEGTFDKGQLVVSVVKGGGTGVVKDAGKNFGAAISDALASLLSAVTGAPPSPPTPPVNPSTPVTPVRPPKNALASIVIVGGLLAVIVLASRRNQ